LKTVARELGIAIALEGSVQRSGDKVRVSVQLLDARADVHLWAKSYDRELKDVFSVESDIAQDVADTLQARLSPSESHVLAAAPTRDPEAYDLFLKAQYEIHQGESTRTTQPFARAVGLYQQALARDPEFALAYARLAYARLFEHFSIQPLAPAELDAVKSRIDHALVLEPDLPEAHLALGLYRYWGYRDYGPAIIEFRRALELQPSNARAREYLGFVYRRQGDWEKSLAEMTRAEELDPLDVNTVIQQGVTYICLRRWNEAQRAVTRALAIDPHFTLAAWLLARICENSRGDIECARRAVETVPAKYDPLEVRYDAAAFIGERSYVDIFERNFAQAVQGWDKPSDDTAGARIRQLEARVAIHVIAGQAAAARSEAEELRSLLESKLKEQPEEAWSMAGLSWAYACLGRNVDALEIARRASEVLSVEKDALSGPRVLVGRAEIAAHTGQAQEAIQILRNLASIPAGSVYSVARLKIDPVWDPIRNRPDFQQLLSAPEQVGPNK
jgi:tetratricopeptide (TPR) repeat protein